MDGHKQTVHMEDGQGVDQHVTLFPAPIIFERDRVAQQIAVREHRPFAAAGGAAGVQNGGQVIGLARRRCVLVTVVRGALEQAARAVIAQREHMLGARLEGEFADPTKIGGAAHYHSRLGVANEVLDLGALVGRVERQEHAASAQASQVQHHRFDRFFDLHGHPAAFR